jgi:hypothetical protein
LGDEMKCRYDLAVCYFVLSRKCRVTPLPRAKL